MELSLIYAQNLELRVRDDGRGIDPDIAAHEKREHFGLTGMQESAARINAKLTVHSGVNAGTEVELVVPGQVIFRDQGSLRRRLTHSSRNINNRLFAV